MIIQTTCSRLFQVSPAGPGLDHVWTGVEVRRVKGGFAPKAKAKPTLVRKAGARPVA